MTCGVLVRQCLMRAIAQTRNRKPSLGAAICVALLTCIMLTLCLAPRTSAQQPASVPAARVTQAIAEARSPALTAGRLKPLLALAYELSAENRSEEHTSELQSL